MNRIEILAPAGSMETFYAAIHAGADAVYLGGLRFGARAYASNFTEDNLIQAIHYAHLHNRKLYLTVNTLLKDEEIDALYDYLLPLYMNGLDAVIVQDLGVLSYIRRQFPDLPVHASTQMTITSEYGVKELEDLGVTRVVPARELSLMELSHMKQHSKIEFEVFVHGALCYCYSGQCLLSSMIGGRSGNRGRCAQPCRLPYQSGELKYWLSPKDLCGLNHIPDLIEAGIDSLKIEGRMKNENYVAACVSAYRKAVDAYYGGTFSEELVAQLTEQMAETFNRGGFTDGYFERHNGLEMMSMHRPNHQGVFVGIISKIQNGTISFIAERDIQAGDIFEIALKNKETMEVTGGFEYKKGEVAILKAPRTKDIVVGSSVYRMKNAKLVEHFQKKILDAVLKENVKVSIRIKKELCARMSLEAFGYKATVEGPIVMVAMNKPLTKENVLEKLLKFGNTPFQVESCELEMDNDAFVSVGVLNQMRRDAVELLEKYIIEGHFRTMVSRSVSDYVITQETAKLPEFSVYPMNMRLLDVTLQAENVKEIYMDPSFFTDDAFVQGCQKAKMAGKKVIICMPHVFRQQAEIEFSRIMSAIDSYDAVLIRTLDELSYAKEHFMDVEWIGDYSLYAYNKESIAYYCEQKKDLQFVIPRELSKEQIKNLQIPNMICDIYGNHPVMVSAQCVKKNRDICTQCNDVVVLTDRKQVKYDVQCVCRYCYNLIFNNVRYHLFGLGNDVADIKPNKLRIILRDESIEEAKQILQIADIEGLDCCQIDVEAITRGHFKRGME